MILLRGLHWRLEKDQHISSIYWSSDQVSLKIFEKIFPIWVRTKCSCLPTVLDLDQQQDNIRILIQDVSANHLDPLELTRDVLIKIYKAYKEVPYKCDMLPENVLIKGNGEVCILDFGERRQIFENCVGNGLEIYSVTWELECLFETKKMDFMDKNIKSLDYSMGMWMGILLLGRQCVIDLKGILSMYIRMNNCNVQMIRQSFLSYLLDMGNRKGIKKDLIELMVGLVSGKESVIRKVVEEKSKNYDYLNLSEVKRKFLEGRFISEQSRNSMSTLCEKKTLKQQLNEIKEMEQCCSGLEEEEQYYVRLRIREIRNSVLRIAVKNQGTYKGKVYQMFEREMERNRLRILQISEEY